MTVCPWDLVKRLTEYFRSDPTQMIERVFLTDKFLLFMRLIAISMFFQLQMEVDPACQGKQEVLHHHPFAQY